MLCHGLAEKYADGISQWHAAALVGMFLVFFPLCNIRHKYFSRALKTLAFPSCPCFSCAAILNQHLLVAMSLLLLVPSFDLENTGALYARLSNRCATLASPDVAPHREEEVHTLHSLQGSMQRSPVAPYFLLAPLGFRSSKLLCMVFSLKAI